MKKYSIAGFLVSLAVVFSPALSFAQTNTSAAAQVKANIDSLLSKVAALQAQIQLVNQQKADINQQIRLTRSLYRGLSGDDVKVLQQMLAQDSQVYPEGFITGHFGALTEKAVKKFQKKYGIEQAGIVGPKTSKQLNKLFAQLNKDANGKGDDDQGENEDGHHATSTRSDDEEHKVTICHKGQETISVDTHALQAHLGHGDSIGACSGGTSTTTPDVLPPVISSVSASINSTSATINWSTNEPSTSLVWLASSTPVTSASGKMSNSNGSLVFSHSLSFTTLSASTTYYYFVVSTDASGNTATSSEHSFTTPPEVSDTTAPFIFGVSATPLVNSASISWMTNESSNSRVWFATSTDILNASNKQMTSDLSLTTNHTVGLSGLTSATTYYFLVVSADAAGNTATSTSNLYTFTTLPLSISSIVATPASTTASINWNTNVSSDSKVWYATSTPVVSASGKLSASNSASVTGHSITLTNLATSTTYYYVVVSKDSFGNAATSSDNSFVTLAL